MECENTDSIVELAATLASRAEEFDKVLILCTKKAGGGYSNDNGVDVKEAVFMVESFKNWILTHMNIPE